MTEFKSSAKFLLAIIGVVLAVISLFKPNQSLQAVSIILIGVACAIT